MVATARKVKQENPDAKVVFIGPCASKKLEAMRRTVRSDVDFVLTFEELDAMFDAREIDPASFEEDGSLHDATAAGRGYAVAGGVAGAIEACLKEYYPMYRFISNMQRVLLNVKSPRACQGRQTQGLYDRRYGLSGRMYGWCRNKCTSCQIIQRTEEVPGRMYEKASAKGTCRY